MTRFCQVIIATAVFVLQAMAAWTNPSAAADSSALSAHWIFLTDKNATTPITLSERAQARRVWRAGASDLTWYDLPVDSLYIERIRESGAAIRCVSRWLNAVSVLASDSALQNIARLPFVSAIGPVSASISSLPRPEYPTTRFFGDVPPFGYGPSYAQVAMLAVDSLHRAGLSGQGVLIGLMDTGFDYNHPVFSNMVSEGRIMITRDFINGDSDVVDQPDIQRFHGTAVLSVLAGFSPDTLVGPAYGAEFILAKTEIVQQEIRAEEDYWVAASEWMESLGVDIISSSLGYNDWYDTTQLDGHTAIITQAAGIANALGVVVVNSAGNEGNTSWRKIIPPADGDSVIAAGAVDFDSAVADFSSRGPTADGRIKPDFCALGVGDYAAVYTGGYGFFSGTSFSAPLLAGGIALLLEGHPQWRLSNIISSMKRAGSMAFLPNNSVGWGIPNFVDAYYNIPSKPGSFSLIIAPHPAEDSVVFYMIFPQVGQGRLSIHDVSGARIAEWTFAVDSAQVVKQVWDGRNGFNSKVASGIYICYLRLGGLSLKEKLFYISKE